MLHWVVDNAGLLYVVLGAVAVALAAGWWTTRDRKYLIPLAVAVALMALVWLLGRFVVVTDRMQIRRNVDAMVAAVLEGNPEGLIRHLARGFEFQGMDRQRFSAYARKALPRKQVHDLHVFNYDTEELSSEKGKAVAAFRVRAGTAWGPAIYFVRLDFVVENEAWRLRRVRIYNPVVNTDQPIQIPLP